MGWAGAIQAARLERTIKELREAKGYSCDQKYPDLIYNDPDISIHPERWEWGGPGTSGYRYIGMKDDKD
jgi:hypothetical protein